MYHSYSSQYSPPSHASSLSSSSAGSHFNYGSGHSSIAARYEAAKSFDLEDDLAFCPALTIDEVRQYYDEVTAKSILFPNSIIQYSPPSQPTTPSPPKLHIHPSPPYMNPARLAVTEPQTPVFRPPSRGRGTAAIKIIDPITREERRRQYY